MRRVIERTTDGKEVITYVAENAADDAELRRMHRESILKNPDARTTPATFAEMHQRWDV